MRFSIGRQTHLLRLLETDFLNRLCRLERGGVPILASWEGLFASGGDLLLNY